VSRVRALAGAIVVVGALLVAPAAARTQGLERPSLRGADAAILIEARSGDALLERDVRERHAIASATKLMTALLALERAKPDDVFTAPAYRALSVESKIGRRAGERMAVRDLLKALLLESANDAAVTIAEGVSGSRARFVAEMNDRARELGLDDTSFANPVGLDDPDNYSSARDLARLAALLMRKPVFAEIVDLPVAGLDSGARPRRVANRNRLVRRIPFVDGIKTGHTRSAGYVLVGSATGSAGVRVISVVLGEPSESARDAESLALLRYGADQFRRVRALRARRPVERVAIKYRDERVALVTGRAVVVTARRGERIRTVVEAPAELEGPLPAGARVGSVSIVRGGRTVRTIDLVTAESVPGAGPLRVVTSPLGVPLTVLLFLAIVLSLTVVVGRAAGVRVRVVRRERSGSSHR
jgi:serine-type D-Ala-D-Ala carboxypeptidase (penicillin-binding protein 5/6)